MNTQSRSLSLVSELGQEVGDLQTLVKAYERVNRGLKARIAQLETELCVAVYDKLCWKAQTQRAAKGVLLVEVR